MERLRPEGKLIVRDGNAGIHPVPAALVSLEAAAKQFILLQHTDVVALFATRVLFRSSFTATARSYNAGYHSV